MSHGQDLGRGQDPAIRYRSALKLDCYHPGFTKEESETGSVDLQQGWSCPDFAFVEDQRTRGPFDFSCTTDPNWVQGRTRKDINIIVEAW
ncbi:hypothetical protein J6590_003445 [Homalodisca vitripennis]|nr:hypothetical protein J6590_003445 [Homalodisca vitripennis]